MNPSIDFQEWMQPIEDRVGWQDLDDMVFVEEISKTYSVAANWALYCDNYLEGFHVPYVHPALNNALDFSKYSYEQFPFVNLQMGIAAEGETHFDLPEGHPDYGKKVFAYYFWLFPNLMLNFYPWGLSLNYVRPLNHYQTEVAFRNYRFKNSPYQTTEAAIDQTEMEDEAVVESVQRGIQSRFYQKGRFSPTMEQCVHHFHRLVSRFMNT